jgi:hypothetical protein
VRRLADHWKRRISHSCVGGHEVRPPNYRSNSFTLGMLRGAGVCCPPRSVPDVSGLATAEPFEAKIGFNKWHAKLPYQIQISHPMRPLLTGILPNTELLVFGICRAFIRGPAALTKLKSLLRASLITLVGQRSVLHRKPVDPINTTRDSLVGCILGGNYRRR